MQTKKYKERLLKFNITSGGWPQLRSESECGVMSEPEPEGGYRPGPGRLRCLLPLSCSPAWTFLERAEGRKRGSQVSLGKAWEGEASRFYSSLLVKSEGDSESAVYSSRASQKCVTIANTTRSLSFPCVTLFIFLLLVPECIL